MTPILPIDSAMIHGAGYDRASQVFEVVFTSGRRYRYENVPECVYEAFLVARSKGRFMQSEIIEAYRGYEIHER